MPGTNTPCKRLDHRVDDQEQEKALADRRRWEVAHDERAHGREEETRPVRPHPRPERVPRRAPARSEPSANDLEREVDEDRDREVLTAEPALNHLERRRGVVRLEAELRNEVHEQEHLHMRQPADRKDLLIHRAGIKLGLVEHFRLLAHEKEQAERNAGADDRPELEVRTKREDGNAKSCAAVTVSIGSIRTGEAYQKASLFKARKTVKEAK
jgi:hypothetical protein